ncbi:uncharacterized protein LOC141716700 [Apium graveolens]|uniref:uncharacterized protein LOC141716700 n=1 Tax=Apium graveolens TaxID=4045 RepID=UPI003D7AC266
MHQCHISTLNTTNISILLLLLLLLHFIVNNLSHFTPFLGSHMGKLDHDTQILHFTHPHPLHLNFNDQTQGTNISTSNNNPVIAAYMLCAGCKLPANSCDDFIYSCDPCNFHLHLSCTKFPHLITHPSHASHPLTLLPVSTYPGGVFNCDACNRRGNGFSYHCMLCDFDLHVVCASKPLSVAHHSHHHPLMLTFKNPYETKGFSCDICSKIGAKQWLYRCDVCEFDAHLHCATGRLPPPLPPQQSVGMTQIHVGPKPSNTNSGISGRLQGFSGMANQQPNRISSGIQNVPETMGFGFNGMTGGVQMQQSFPADAGRPNNYYGSEMQRHQSYPGTGGGRMQPQQQSYPGTGDGGGMQPQQQSYSVANGGGLMNAAIQGLVEGAAQQVGQNLMQSLIGGSGGDGSASSIYVNLGPTYTENRDSSDTQDY